MAPKKEGSDIDDEKPIAMKKTTTKLTKPKKQEYADSDDEKPIARKKTTPNQTKPKNQPPLDDKKILKRKREEKKVVEEVKKRQKKVYALPGQKRDPPEERDPLRIFYQTLYEQKPTSELAAVWMMESGLLEPAVAKKVYEKKMKTKSQRVTTPTKAVKTVKKETHSVTVRKKVEASTPNSSAKKKTTVSTSVSKQIKKKLKAESSEEDPTSEEDSEEEDFDPTPQKSGKKAKAN